MNHYTNARPTFDAKDNELLDEKVAARRQRLGPLVGDYVRMPNGELERFSYDWGRDIQTSKGGSFFLHGCGTAEFSGGLNPAISKSLIKPTGETKPARFWFFHHNVVQAHNGVHFEVDVPVYDYNPHEGYLGL